MTKTYLVPPAPPHNEGKTIAAWVFSALVVLGCTSVAVAMIASIDLLVWVGIALLIVACVAGVVLRHMGFGQKRRA